MTHALKPIQRLLCKYLFLFHTVLILKHIWKLLTVRLCVAKAKQPGSQRHVCRKWMTDGGMVLSPNLLPSLVVRLAQTNTNTCRVTEPVIHPSHQPLTCPSMTPPAPQFSLPRFILTRFSSRTYKCISPSAKSDNPSIIGNFIDPSCNLLICLLGTRNKATLSWNPNTRDTRTTCTSGAETRTNLDFLAKVEWNIIPMLFCSEVRQ